jgi:hypothetical protein
MRPSAIGAKALVLIATAKMLIATPKRFEAARRLGLVVAFQLCVAFSSSSPAAAWGRVAHAAIATLAEQQLTPEAGKEVRRLLALEDASRLADVVMWADLIRRQNLPGTPDHDVPIPFDADSYDAARDCQGFCIVKGIPFYLEALADRTKPDAERLEALKYVIHLVGDIHQPLHTSQDGGSQLVAWDTKVVYLHILWDVTILVATYPTPDVLAPAISKRLRPLSGCGTAEEWANEGHTIEKTFVYPELGPERRQPLMISEDYASKALPIIEERVSLATTRLACVLNGALDPRR